MEILGRAHQFSCFRADIPKLGFLPVIGLAGDAQRFPHRDRGVDRNPTSQGQRGGQDLVGGDGGVDQAVLGGAAEQLVTLAFSVLDVTPLMEDDEDLND